MIAENHVFRTYRHRPKLIFRLRSAPRMEEEFLSAGLIGSVHVKRNRPKTKNAARGGILILKLR
jgi:hypothetical protein